MFQQSSYTDQLTFFQKIRSFDYVLLICIILIGIISAFSMYSTDGGELLYHSKSHVIRLIVFFSIPHILNLELEEQCVILQWKLEMDILQKKKDLD